MRKGVIVIVLLIMLLVLGVLIFRELMAGNESPELNEEFASVKPGEVPVLANESGASNLSSDVPEGGTAEGVSGGGGGSGGAGGGGSTPESEEVLLPTDLHTAPCGTYFTRYNICTGSCTEGLCTGEGRSCYCKIQ